MKCHYPCFYVVVRGICQKQLFIPKTHMSQIHHIMVKSGNIRHLLRSGDTQPPPAPPYHIPCHYWSPVANVKPGHFTKQESNSSDIRGSVSAQRWVDLGLLSFVFCLSMHSRPHHCHTRPEHRTYAIREASSIRKLCRPLSVLRQPCLARLASTVP